jgi:hypothetical protein
VPSLRFGLALMLFPLVAPCQMTVNTAAIAEQQTELSQHVLILRTNFATFWMMVYPEGAPFATKNHKAERDAAAPQYQKLDGVVAVNDGLGCVLFIRNDGSNIPNVCAPVDVRAKLAMEALREDWENGRSVPRDKNEMFNVTRDSIPSLWAQEKTLYCILRPEAQYIDLDDSLRSCTPKVGGP